MTGLKTRISPINSIYTLKRGLKIQFYSPTIKYYATSRGNTYNYSRDKFKSLKFLFMSLEETCVNLLCYRPMNCRLICIRGYFQCDHTYCNLTKTLTNYTRFN